MLQHRIHVGHDAFTKNLVEWDRGKGTGSARQEHILTLTEIMPGMAWGHLTNLPYQVAKEQLKESARRIQEECWKERETVKGHLTAHAARSKPHWGM